MSILLDVDEIKGVVSDALIQSTFIKIQLGVVGKAQAKKIAEWGNEHDPCATNVVRSKRECFRCWQELLKEIE